MLWSKKEDVGVDEKEKVVVLFSGGSDSTLLIELAHKMEKEVFAVLVDYGQVIKEELEYAKKYLEKNDIEYKEVIISGYDVSSGLTTGEKGMYTGVHEMNVPARNTIFLSIAAGIAESNRIREVWIGCDMDDFYGKFADCFQSYIAELNNTFKIAFSYPITVEAPLLGFRKKMVLKLLKDFGIEEKDLYSGYREFV